MANLPANKAKGTVTKNKLDEIVEHEPEGGQYPTPGGPAPKSSQIQMWANEKEINLLVIDSGKDDEQAWAKCRAVIAKTGQFVESRVVLRYKDVEERLMITQVKKILKEAPRGATETPVLKSLKEPLLINEEGRIMANYKPYGLMEFMKKMSNYRYHFIVTGKQIGRAHV